MNIDLIKQLAKSDYRKNLTLYLQEVQSYIADIRNGKYSNESRIIAVEAIQKLLIDKLHTLSGDVVKNTDDYR